MYAEFFRFSSLPFQLTPDSRFFFESKGHSKAFAHLLYGLGQGEGFIVITGEVGAGKTTLVEHLFSELDSTKHVAARISTTQVAADDFLRMVVSAFGLPFKGADKAAMLRDLEEFFQMTQRAGKRAVLVVDEVQNLPFATLEELRMLSNLVVGSSPPLQSFLLGQPQFRRTLASQDAEQLRQRVLASFHLGAMNEAETRSYIEHRLQIVGWSGDPTFDHGAFRAIFDHTSGIPRRINVLCSRILLSCFLEEAHRITEKEVHQVAEEWHGETAGVDADQRSAGSIVSSAGNRTMPVETGAEIGDKLSNRLGRVEAELAKHATALRRTLDVVTQFLQEGQK